MAKHNQVLRSDNLQIVIHKARRRGAPPQITVLWPGTTFDFLGTTVLDVTEIPLHGNGDNYEELVHNLRRMEEVQDEALGGELCTRFLGHVLREFMIQKGLLAR